MGKSSSLKKKRSKDSSQSRMRKRNKVKSKKSKSKKLRRRRDDSVSYSSDSDSASMVSVSSFSTEGDCSGRRSRSRNRKDIKGGKKRSRRLLSSSEDSTIVKKRRGSRRGDTRKRNGKRKKSMRDVSVSSRSSRSLSSSTSPSDNDEIEYEKRRSRPERKEKYRRSEKVKRGSKRSKGQSRASSSCSRDSEGSDHSIEERVTEDSNFRRLKSVITVVEQVDESTRELIADEPKEDVYDYDDYPSCRSNDSNDGCSRWELGQHTHAVSERTETIKPPDDEQVEVSNIRTGNVEVINVSSAADGLNGDDIESILRQRALENLKKFRGELQKNINPPITPNDKSVGDVKTPSSENTDSFQIKAPKADDGRVVIASDSSTLPKDNRNTTNTSDDGKCSETTGRDVASPSARLVPTGIPGKEVNTGINSVSNKPRLVISRTGLEAPNARDTQKQETVTQEPSMARYVTKTSVDEGDLETAQAVKPSNDSAATVSNRPKSVKLRIGREPPNTCTTQKQESAALKSPQAKFVTKTNVDEGDLETAQAVKPSIDNAASVSNRPKYVKLRIGREPPNACTTQKQESAALISPQAKFVTETSVKESNLRTAQTVSPEECGNLDGKDNDTSASTCDKPSPSGNISSDKQEDETKGGSQFQQKTMSVMRGGEMVQVSYQVYIPKRAPALARRQLKR
ncbi:hypothetical protein HRI_004195900 [Hibiscus trionum]|uniref:Uncharacterized protein n=1 Tax=Hibiscus trionum TaxID=183268 RepID=A0A9W7J236_HIBTR|nr:hypothetical protein HRI_004195900 [Hibiscus trionum]